MSIKLSHLIKSIASSVNEAQQLIDQDSSLSIELDETDISISFNSEIDEDELIKDTKELVFSRISKNKNPIENYRLKNESTEADSISTIRLSFSKKID